MRRRKPAQDTPRARLLVGATRARAARPEHDPQPATPLLTDADVDEIIASASIARIHDALRNKRVPHYRRGAMIDALIELGDAAPFLMTLAGLPPLRPGAARLARVRSLVPVARWQALHELLVRAVDLSAEEQAIAAERLLQSGDGRRLGGALSDAPHLAPTTRAMLVEGLLRSASLPGMHRALAKGTTLSAPQRDRLVAAVVASGNAKWCRQVLGDLPAPTHAERAALAEVAGDGLTRARERKKRPPLPQPDHDLRDRSYRKIRRR